MLVEAACWAKQEKIIESENGYVENLPRQTNISSSPLCLSQGSIPESISQQTNLRSI